MALTRAKWALDTDELQTMKDRAQFFGLDKTEGFREFEEKYLKAEKVLQNQPKKRTMKVEVLDPATGEYYSLAHGSRLQNVKIFAGKGGTKPLREAVVEGLSEEFGGRPENWQHAKGIGALDADGEEVLAEIHWFQEETVGRVKFKVKEWLE